MHYRTRILAGLVLITASLFILWYGSPDRLGTMDSPPPYAYGFVGLFAVGFILFSMAALGGEDAYPALISGFVLYFMIGGVVAAFIYASDSSLAEYSLDDAASATFWAEAASVAIMWPLKLVQGAGLLGWNLTPY